MPIPTLKSRARIEPAAVSKRSFPDDPYPVQRLGYTVDDIDMLSMEAERAAFECTVALEQGCDVERTRRALTRCQHCVLKLFDHFVSDLTDYKHLNQLRASTRKLKSRAWSGWSSGVVDSIGSCRAPMLQASTSILTCWQELAERRAGPHLNIHATGIRQVASTTEDQ